MEGTLSKWTNVMKGWQYRYFVLDDNAGLFSYYTTKEKMMRGARRGCVRLRGALIGIDDEDDSTFTITVDGKTFHFQAKNAEEREKWIRSLEDTVLRHNGMRISQKAGVENHVHPETMEDFDKKLAETDSYLQLMINQVSGLKSKINHSSVDNQEAAFQEIANKAIGMTESIKHAIVLLQIAKNTTNPPAESGVKHFNTEKATEVGSHGSSASSPARTVEILKEAKEDVGDDTVKPSLKVHHPAIPEISYESSEEEFEDANEHFDDDEKKEEEEEDELDNVSKSDHMRLNLEINDSEEEEEDEGATSPMVTDENNVPIDFDGLYEDDGTEEDVDMKSHGSVITHLLSQVRIGMDLTKIVLPTFILERRSLLEMYSDFFAHPDIVVSIADGKDPEERMVLVLKWYLSSFHAGRKSSIAKKPYNPIIGETFRCHWNVDPSEQPLQGVDVSKITKTSQLPWCSPNDLTFVAEQVSHHPPVSAFYVEHINKKIAVNGHIYTKSSFLGMSVAVHMIGKGSLRLLDHDEEYVATFPSGFGRSILTVPWVELGGKVGLKCVKTGYSANVEFKCKQFFSSDVNKLSAEVFSPNSKKPFLKVDGEWNGKMTAKWASGKTEPFIDVNQLPVCKKHCKPIAEQKKFESRRLWKNVTYNLKHNNIDAATGAKFALEQRQREEAAQRKEEGRKWETKLFDREVNDGPVTGDCAWFFKNPLDKRLKENKL